MRNLNPLTFLALVLSIPAQALQDAQQPVVISPPVYVTAIELVADVRDSTGKLPEGLTPDDFIVLEDGVERRVIGVDYLRHPPGAPLPVATATASAPLAPAEPEWQIVLYFDLTLSNAQSSYWSARGFIKDVDELVKRGAVDVVVASPSPTALLRGSRDPKAIVAALNGVIERRGQNRIWSHRQAFQREKNESGAVTTQQELARARMYVEQEIMAIRQFSSNLSTWLSQYGKHIPRALFVAADGFDLDPVAYYAAELDSADETDLRTHFLQSDVESAIQHLSDLIAAGGWTTFGVLGNPLSLGSIRDAATPPTGRVRAFARANRAPKPGAKAYFNAPQAPLQVISDTTGGRLVANVTKLDGTVRDLDDRVLLTYQVPRAPDGTARRVVIRSRRPGLTVRYSKWGASSTPDEIATARVVQTLREGASSGDLHVQGSFDWETEATGRQGILRISVPFEDLKPVLPAGSATTFLLTIGVDVGSQRTWIVHRRSDARVVAGGIFEYRVRLNFPAEAHRVAVAVEETTSGMWGTAGVALQ